MTTRLSLRGVDAAMAEFAQRAGQQLPVILRLFAEEALRDIRPAWPVDTGRSAEALTVIISGRRAAIVCRVPYAQYIRPAGSDRPLWEILILHYMRDNMDAIAARVTRRLGG